MKTICILAALCMVALFMYSPSLQAGRVEDKRVREALAEYGRDSARLFGLKFLLVGNPIPEKTFFYAILYTSDMTLQLNQGRRLAAPVAFKYVSMNCENEVMKKRILSEFDRRKISHSGTLTPDMALQYISFRIAFWDKNNNRPAAPYLSEIHFFDGIFHYYEADPKTQALKLVFEESYEEGLKFWDDHRG